MSLEEFSPAEELQPAIFDIEGGFDLALRFAVLAGGDHLERSVVVLDRDGDGVVAHAVHVESSRGPVAGLGSAARWAFAISIPASASSKACSPLLTATTA